MGMQKIPITDASDADLRLFAALVLGLQVKSKANRETIIASIKTAWPQDYVVLSFDVAEQATMQVGDAPRDPSEVAPKRWTKDEIERNAGRGFVDAPSSTDPRVSLIINETTGAQGKEAVFVQVNGRGILFPRRKLITIAYRHYLVLVAAITDEVEQDFANEMLVTNEVQRFPLNVRTLPTQAEIDEWDRQQSVACGQAA